MSWHPRRYPAKERVVLTIAGEARLRRANKSAGPGPSGGWMSGDATMWRS